MKLIVAILFCCSLAQAQEITNIKGEDVTVSVPSGQHVGVGDPISFLEGTAIVARGTIQKVSKDSTSVVVRIKDGAVKKGQQADFFKVLPPSPANPIVHTPEDLKILERGEIGTTRYVIGGLVAIYPGFGFGHLIQGRWKQRGWVFLAGEGAAGAALVVGAYSCIFSSILDRSSNCDNGFFQAAGILYAGFKIWEVIDAWAVPPQLNRRYRMLKGQTVDVSGSLIPTPDGGYFTMKIVF